MKIIDVTSEVVNSYTDPNDLAVDWVLGVIEKLKSWWRTLMFSSQASQSEVVVVVPPLL